jgi:hypothetical protein
MKKESKRLIVELSGNVNVPKGKILLKSPMAAALKSVVVNGAKRMGTGDVVIETLPARVELKY